MMYPLVRELAADRIPVAVTCRVLKIARQPYYRWLANPVTDAELTEAYLANALSDAHRDDPEIGYRFLADEAREAGFAACDRTMWRVCSTNGWWSAFGKKRGMNGKKPGPPVHDDLVKRDFTAEAANQLWLANITEHWTSEDKLYLCPIKDVFSNRIVGYSISDRMKSRLAVDALANAVARRGEVAGCILHTDRGAQFRSWKVVRALHHHHMVGSMGKVGAAAAISLLNGPASTVPAETLRARMDEARQVTISRKASRVTKPVAKDAGDRSPEGNPQPAAPTNSYVAVTQSV
jgi:putative transposase